MDHTVRSALCYGGMVVVFNLIAGWWTLSVQPKAMLEAFMSLVFALGGTLMLAIGVTNTTLWCQSMLSVGGIVLLVSMAISLQLLFGGRGYRPPGPDEPDDYPEAPPPPGCPRQRYRRFLRVGRRTCSVRRTSLVP